MVYPPSDEALRRLAIAQLNLGLWATKHLEKLQELTTGYEFGCRIVAALREPGEPIEFAHHPPHQLLADLCAAVNELEHLCAERDAAAADVMAIGILG